MTPLRGFIGPSAQGQFTAVNAERTVNWYLGKAAIAGGTPRSAEWLLGTPGLVAVGTAGTGPHRAAFQQDGRSFLISGTGFYEFFSDHSVTLRGTVAAGTDMGTIVSNGDAGGQLLVVVGGYGYVYNKTTNILTQIADPDFPQGTASMCCFLDGYGIVLQSSASTFQISALEDFTSWDALDVAQKSQTSDRLVALAVDFDHKVLWLFGSQNTEVWWDAGGTFPFEPVPNSIISLGLSSPFGVSQPTEGIVWIGENSDGGRAIWSAQGSASKRVSTSAVEVALSDYSTVNDCSTFEYIWRGHVFSVFLFPTADACWVYDNTTEQWHEWLSWNVRDGDWHLPLARTHIFAFENHYVGSATDGTIYELSANTAADGSQTLRRLRRSPHVVGDGSWITCHRLRFDFQSGVGTSGQGATPQAMVRISRDGGKTFGDERWVPLGATGAYTTRAELRRNGRWRDGVIEVVVTDPVVTAMVGAWGDFEGAAA